MITFNLNGETQSLDVDPNTPVLSVIREQLGLTGTKFGCGMALWVPALSISMVEPSAPA